VRVVLADIEAPALEAAAAALRARGADVLALETDVTDPVAVGRLADAAWARFGSVHILFNNAGVIAVGEVEELSLADWDWCLQVNLWGAIHGVDAFLPRLIAQREPAHILFTASFAGLVGNRRMAAYSVSKAATVSLAECLHRELSAHDIGVSVLCPMRVESNIDQSFRNRPEALGGPARTATFSDDQLKAMVGRTLSSEAVADLVVAGIRRKQLYIHTHREARDLLQRRWQRLDAAFADLP
jgi:NAD(P)-dependent dehydrogenase (short-subunit alcohol dehydrogenase family)